MEVNIKGLENDYINNLFLNLAMRTMNENSLSDMTYALAITIP